MGLNALLVGNKIVLSCLVYSYIQNALFCYLSVFLFICLCVCPSVCHKTCPDYSWTGAISGMISNNSCCAYHQHLHFCQNYGLLMIFMVEYFLAELRPLIEKGVFCDILHMYNFQHHQLGNSALKTQNATKLSNHPSNGYRLAKHVFTDHSC